MKEENLSGTPLEFPDVEQGVENCPCKGGCENSCCCSGDQGNLEHCDCLNFKAGKGY